MGWADIDDGFIKVKQEKTKAHLGIPIAAALAEALKDIPKERTTFLVSSQGEAFTGAGMGNWFRVRCDEARLKHCSIYGLRKAAARRLAEAGCTDRQIMSITGHKTAQEVGPYTRSAEQMKLAGQAMDLLRVSNPASSVGRLHRQRDGKNDVLVVDYVDANVPVLARMAVKRRAGYRALGYEFE